jgi:proteasome lid subunit RPN8/RPN11
MPHVEIHLSEKILAEIVDLGLLRYPMEACGVLLPPPTHYSQVIELPNRSKNGHDSYEIWPADVRVAIENWAKSVDEDQRNRIAIWHTHPQGNVGPSRGDLHNRIEGATYLVVALDITTGLGTPSWF